MNQLDALWGFINANLKERLRISASDMEMDNLRITRQTKNLGLGQIRTAIRQYDAVIYLYRWPYEECNPDIVLQLILAWMDEHANTLQDEISLGEPEMEATIDNGEKSAEVIFTIPMADELVLREDENGIIPRGGKRYSLVEPQVWVAEKADVRTTFAKDDAP